MRPGDSILFSLSGLISISRFFQCFRWCLAGCAWHHLCGRPSCFRILSACSGSTRQGGPATNWTACIFPSMKMANMAGKSDRFCAGCVLLVSYQTPAEVPWDSCLNAIDLYPRTADVCGLYFLALFLNLNSFYVFLNWLLYLFTKK